MWQAFGYTEKQQRIMNDHMLRDGACKRYYVVWAHDPYAKKRLLTTMLDIIKTAAWGGAAPQFHKLNALKVAHVISKSVEESTFPTGEFVALMEERSRRLAGTHYQKIMLAGANRLPI